MRGGTQPTPSGTYRGRSSRGWLVGLGRRAVSRGRARHPGRALWGPHRCFCPIRVYLPMDFCCKVICMLVVLSGHWAVINKRVTPK
eukprot:scaffold87439_cov54-Phaeocystis_antarctica.AAC.2